MRYFIFSAFFLIFFMPLTLSAQQPSSIPSGLHSIDLDQDGHDEFVIKAWRENFNAHGFFTLSFYKIQDDGALLIIPVEDSKTGEFLNAVQTLQGADCIVQDYRLLKSGTLIKAYRDLGEGFSDVKPVTFEMYRLQKNVDELPGIPRWFYKKFHVSQTSKRYCDVEKAFLDEGNILNK